MSLVGGEGGFGGGFGELGNLALALGQVFGGGGGSRLPGPRQIAASAAGPFGSPTNPFPVTGIEGGGLPGIGVGGGACITPQLRTSIGLPRIVDVPLLDASGNLKTARYVKAPMPRYTVRMTNPTRGRRRGCR